MEHDFIHRKADLSTFYLFCYLLTDDTAVCFLFFWMILDISIVLFKTKTNIWLLGATSHFGPFFLLFFLFFYPVLYNPNLETVIWIILKCLYCISQQRTLLLFFFFVLINTYNIVSILLYLFRKYKKKLLILKFSAACHLCFSVLSQVTPQRCPLSTIGYPTYVFAIWMHSTVQNY